MSEEKYYIGSKIIKGSPMKGPESNMEGYKVIYPDGYISWSPKDAFENAYREITEAEIKLLDKFIKQEG